MITLKDYIGNIYKEITKARVQSDIETVEVAKEYAKHDLLKHFSIPNMRMKNVEITVPIAIDNPEVKLPTVSQRFVLHSLMKVTSQIVKETEGKKIIDKNNLNQLKRAHNQNISFLKSPSGSTPITTTKLNAFVGKTSPAFYEYLKPQLGNLSEKEFTKTLNDRVTKEVVGKEKAQLEKIPVIIQTSKLRDVKVKESLMNIKIIIEEDTMEWMRGVDDDGNTKDFLSYE